jgi:predicted transcriptional regulator
MMKKLVVGIANAEKLKKRSIAISKGEYVPKRGEPKVWFSSLESFAKVLSERNVELLKVIAEHQPKDYTELVALSGRSKPSLSRTLKTMERYGLIELERGNGKRVTPHALYTDVEVKYQLLAAI